MTNRSMGMTVRRVCTGVLMVAALAGCALGPRLVHTEVTSFNAWSTLPADRTYTFARTLEYQNSLELKTYEDLVRDELALQGFVLAAEPSKANLVVTLRPSVSGTALQIGDDWAFGPFGFGPYGGYYGGFYGARRFYGYGPFYGAYGFPGYFDDRRTVEIFKRRLELDIDARAPDGKRFYEGRVESTGQSDSLPRAMPVLIRALFTDFPGNNGQTRNVDVPVELRPVAQK